MVQKQKLILSLGDILIPLFGLFYLDWTLYFIALYLLFDLLGSYIFYIIKAKKRIAYSKSSEDKNKFRSGTISLTLTLLAVIAATHLFALNTNPQIDFSQAFVSFLMYIEEPIPLPQFWFLIPLILLPPYQQYKMEFIMRQKFRTTTVNSLTASFRKDLLFAIAFLGIGIGISYFLVLPSFLWLLGFIILKLVYDLYLKERILAKTERI